MSKRKETHHHLDIYNAEYDRKTGDIILTGVSANSKQKSWDRPLIKIHLKPTRWLPEHLIEVAAQKPAHDLEKAQKAIIDIKNRLALTI